MHKAVAVVGRLRLFLNDDLAGGGLKDPPTLILCVFRGWTVSAVGAVRQLFRLGGATDHAAGQHGFRSV